ncbi:hypothetical protein CL6EHI_129340 [Entamoeba histolytica]|uniref:FHA domain-containing protein n=3 Tax=Entamoeba histolytica TaxID=5759 RepID=C4M9W7_ENTH1|nr:hypothetical protein EHI_129340 [Entamoeba histolytica HM-1:IMSS]EAL46542.1 hypothetical protein EHI_129340 [Entamoeba histolytica HM-1:IMSS]ENY63062.1 hypothetical protein EHI7A_021930 [Entamoeba histolytica HM-1:IMSS-A]GAT98526.1 hypothetical protein CL6EHI_129340 [Entamoeba histolytica]|eukprot:XP_651928.1 hypothetical protein EHI_129340 [Entamoeba histolytica HM-1:IMSS]
MAEVPPTETKPNEVSTTNNLVSTNETTPTQNGIPIIKSENTLETHPINDVQKKPEQPNIQPTVLEEAKKIQQIETIKNQEPKHEIVKTTEEINKSIEVENKVTEEKSQIVNVSSNNNPIEKPTEEEKKIEINEKKNEINTLQGEKQVDEKKTEEKQVDEVKKEETKHEELPKTLGDPKCVPNKDEKILGEYKFCRFCEGEPYETNVCYLPIINNRVGNFPIVLKLNPKCQSNYICLHHWRENRREYLEHYVQNEKGVIDEASVLLYASMLDKKINFNYVPSMSSIPEDTRNLFSKYLSLRRQELEMAMGSVPAGLSVTSDLLCNACNAPTQQMFDMSLFPQSFIQFLAWQRLMQIYSKLDANNIEMLNALKKEGIKEAEKVVKDATKFATENPNDARKRLQPDYVPEKVLAKKPFKQENGSQFILPPISTASNAAVSLPPISTRQETRVRINYPYFENEETKTKMMELTKPTIIIGRKGRENNVDLDLSAYMEAKSISHTHAIVQYDVGTKRWKCLLKGRNGLKIDTVFKNKDTVTELHNGSIIETGTFKFSFHCPDDFDGNF